MTSRDAKTRRCAKSLGLLPCVSRKRGPFHEVVDLMSHPYTPMLAIDLAATFGVPATLGVAVGPAHSH